MQGWELFLGVANFVMASGVFAVALRLNYKWNVALDRVDLLYREYCDEHHIPFVGLKNDF
jgi:hypothetical protein